MPSLCLAPAGGHNLFLSQRAPCVRSRSALIQLAGAIFVPLPSPLHSRLPVSPGRETLHASGALAFMAATQGTPLDCLAPETRGRALLGPIGDCNNQTVIGRLPPSGHETDSRLKHMLFFCERSLFAWLELQPEAQASGLAHV